MRWPPSFVLEALRASAKPILDSVFRPDCCIGATRIGIEVLKRFGIHGQPKPVTTVVGCRAWVEWQDRAPNGPPPPNAFYLLTDTTDVTPGFPGHLVITGKAAGEHFILDLSAAQFDRPHKNIVCPDPILLKLPWAWPPDRGIAVDLPDGGRLIYEHHPRSDIRWDTSRDWTVPAVRRPIFERLVGEMVAAVEAEDRRRRSDTAAELQFRLDVARSKMRGR